MRGIALLISIVIIALLIGQACSPDLRAEAEAKAKACGAEMVWTKAAD